MHYVIHQTDGIQFFPTESEAIEYHEEAYFACACEPMPVPEDSVCYWINHGNGIKAVFSEDMADCYDGFKPIRMEE